MTLPFDLSLLHDLAERERLIPFLSESLRIEGIERAPSPAEIEATWRFLKLDRLTLAPVRRLQAVYAPGMPLRDQPGMNVWVGSYAAPPGGPEIGKRLTAVLKAANKDADPWQTHVTFEKLHPFLDGNGRAGRAIWAWQMRRQGRDPFALPFLHWWYYQTLAAMPYKGA